jgi:hypothetical protein
MASYETYPSQQVVQNKAPTSKKYAIGFLCAAVICFIVGGGLLGGAVSSSNCTTTYDSFNNPDTICDGGHSGLWFAGVAFIAIGAIFKFCFWVALIIWCVKRRQNTTIVYVNNPGGAPKYGA